jgi:hypothetical protein
VSDQQLNDACDQVQARLEADEALATLEAHVKECPACTELVAFLAEVPAAADERRLSPELDLDPGFAALQAQVGQESGLLSALRSWPTGRRRALLLGVGLAVLAAVWAIAPWKHLEPARAGLSVAGLGAILLAALWQSLRPIHQPPLPRWAWWVMVVLAVAFPFALSTLPAAWVSETHKSGGMCFGFGCLFGFPILLLGYLLNRAPTGAVVGSGLLLALAAGGALGGVTLDAHCGTPGMVHRVLGHGALAATWVGLGLVGLALGVKGARPEPAT